MKKVKMLSIGEVLQQVMNTKPVKRTKEQQKGVDEILRELGKSKGFSAFQIQVPAPKK